MGQQRQVRVTPQATLQFSLCPQGCGKHWKVLSRGLRHSASQACAGWISERDFRKHGDQLGICWNDSGKMMAN